jgi:hypothetical protein
VKVRTGLLVRLEATPGREDDAERFLRQALPVADAELETVAWFALRVGPSSFAVFDACPDRAGRQARLTGEVAKALGELGGGLFAGPPSIEPADVLAVQWPGSPG